MPIMTTLAMAAVAAIINIWLMLRVGSIRRAAGISVGDGGDDSLIRRMRAQSNFLESAPFVILLIAAIEISGRGGIWLTAVGGAYMIGRVLHAIGMDGKLQWGRFVGTIVTLLTLLGLAVVAVLITLGMM